ncbi:deoxyribodipyrimidine photolyase-related protein [Legionella geestiana]|uniref:Deoxyribodipyrimidine photolyase-related protein n=1 Tax=Legionella geestiana TaxID=45065 RepID=A0A0W0U7T4_9GAMM|nr:cryptochrome/photolyase family protein [Legionella geestiana]KTD03960.1 deoxyribodipyrimidine photolyase-related protein [Legionella geestiana]QBS12965.1 cryptochrome/photolyase family protein [Legionella geestiana]QDQ39353.1 cryptochrome/photolyase family protein [Legionella geestiana]STX54529.1 deoxyribodipyrimidine photolyase-related protein [Legionella geestiana]
MKRLHLVLGNQLSESISSLKDFNPEKDLVLMCEVMEEATYVRHHQKKIAFLFSAMRHFAHALSLKGYQVEYTRLDDLDNAGSFRAEVQRALKRHTITRIVVTHPGEFRVLEDMMQWEAAFGIPVDIRPDDSFLCTLEEFSDWAKDRKQLRMEYFYREMRRKYSILMEGDKPIGGQWNYDAENRKPPSKRLAIPKPYVLEPDAITEEVMAMVEARFSDHFGHLRPFYFAVTREQALKVLEVFIEQRLVHFGDYQDAMLEGEPWMYHAHISFYLNCGLLLPLECISAVQEAYFQGRAPLNAVEGFIRQIMGWREYVRGIYWLKMPHYREMNFFAATRNLPDFYWSADTKMNCLAQCVSETQKNAYAHHIQRLMVLGNFALLAGIDPAQVNAWFLIVYADAYEWVELPNVSGMILFADGGYLASKPYAAGGSYIHKMSDYCKHCHYNVLEKTGSSACPFNYLYWNFLSRNREKLQFNQRLSAMYKTYDKMSAEKKYAIEKDSAEFLRGLEEQSAV